MMLLRPLFLLLALSASVAISSSSPLSPKLNVSALQSGVGKEYAAYDEQKQDTANSPPSSEPQVNANESPTLIKDTPPVALPCSLNITRVFLNGREVTVKLALWLFREQGGNCELFVQAYMKEYNASSSAFDYQAGQIKISREGNATLFVETYKEGETAFSFGYKAVEGWEFESSPHGNATLFVQTYTEEYTVFDVSSLQSRFGKGYLAYDEQDSENSPASSEIVQSSTTEGARQERIDLPCSGNFTHLFVNGMELAFVYAYWEIDSDTNKINLFVQTMEEDTDTVYSLESGRVEFNPDWRNATLFIQARTHKKSSFRFHFNVEGWWHIVLLIFLARVMSSAIVMLHG